MLVQVYWKHVVSIWLPFEHMSDQQTLWSTISLSTISWCTQASGLMKLITKVCQHILQNVVMNYNHIDWCHKLHSMLWAYYMSLKTSLLGNFASLVTWPNCDEGNRHIHIFYQLILPFLWSYPFFSQVYVFFASFYHHSIS